MVVDDHPAVQEALSKVIQAEPSLELVGVVSSGAEAIDLVSKELPDVAVVDVSLQDIDGLVLIERLQQLHRDLQVVVFSMHDEMIFGERSIRAGASSYLMKDAPTDRVVEAIQRTSRGEMYVSRKLAAKLLGRQLRERGGGVSVPKREGDGERG